MELLEALINSVPDMVCSLIVAWLAYVEITRRNGGKGEHNDD